jgi:Carboxypeptidase regulatory-like domain
MQAAQALCLVLVCALAAQAQVTTGNVRGTVSDPQGSVVPGAKVTITKKSNNESKDTQTSSEGAFQFNNLLVGDDYTITITATGFKTQTINNVSVRINQFTDIPTQLTVGGVGETVEVTAGGVELVDTTTANLSKSFTSRQVVELAQTTVGGPGGGPGAGVNNLSLIAPNVSSSGGVGVGTGGSVGGQRPRNNNFIVDGIDNNDKSVTGPQSYISPEEVAEFTLLQNQFSAEFGRSNGGQFITVTKSGTNVFHGSFYAFGRNRSFNALDNQLKIAGITRDENPRLDYFRGGMNFSGPVYLPRFGEGGPSYKGFRTKLFFFSSYERLQQGSGASATPIFAPTAAGLAALSGIPGLSTNNLDVFRTFVPPAGTQDTDCDNNHDGNANEPCFVTVRGVSIPRGTVFISAPNFFKQNHVVENLDYDQSGRTQHKFRFTMTNLADIDNAANLPQFFIALPLKQRLFSYTLLHTFTPNLVNETRLAFRRSTQNFPVPNVTFPGLTDFPNITIDELGVNIGPDPNAPQFTIENNYQVIDNITYQAGNHALKFGGDFRNIISPQTFVQRLRGDYEYGHLETFLRDISPDVFGERNAGNNVYYGNQHVLYAFAQDDWHVRPNLTLNMGVNYSYQQVPLGARTSQPLNAISSVPGLIEFREPKAQTKNFAPKVGFAYSPNFKEGMLGRLFGEGGKTSIRGGFSMAYDYIFDNLYILSNPPQLQQTNDVDVSVATPNFLANGGLPNTPVTIDNAADARAQTAGFIPDQQVPYSLTWTGSVQRQFMKDWSVELRYLGTRGVHLLTQNRINVQEKVDPALGLPGLPTFVNRPSQAQIDALTLTLAQIQARPNIVPAYAAAGFNNINSPIVAFLSNGNSIYHGGSAQLQKRFSNGLQFTSAYTFSHLIDDTTAEVFSTVLSPRRVQNFQNLRTERANSALDHRHRFVTSGIYELPFFRNDSSHFLRTALGGFSLAGTYTWESGEQVTIRSGTDANLNNDSAGDRGIFNPAGQEGVGTLVDPLVRTDGQIVGYVAQNSNARYIQAAAGAVSNLGRNTFSLPPINNVDFSIFKNFRFGETKLFQLRADMFNVFNHPQYVAGSVNAVDPIPTTGVTRFNQISPSNPDFLKPSQIFSSNPRVIQFAARFNF